MGLVRAVSRVREELDYGEAEVVWRWEDVRWMENRG